MKKKRARTKTENLGSRLKKAVKKVFKKSKPVTLSSRQEKKTAEINPKPARKNPSKVGVRTLTSVSRNRLYVTVKGKVKTGAETAEVPADLPFSYNKTQLVLLVRDPEWAYAYWDFSAETWNWIQGVLKSNPGAPAKLRIHNLTAGNFYDLDVRLEGKNWYICLGLDNTEFEAELGLIDAHGKFLTIVRSNRVRTPRSKPSDDIDPNWVPEFFDEIYRLSGGGSLAGSSSLQPAVKKSSS